MKPIINIYIFKDKHDARIQVVKDSEVIYDQATGIEWGTEVAFAFDSYVIPFRDMFESIGFDAHTTVTDGPFKGTKREETSYDPFV